MDTALFLEQGFQGRKKTFRRRINDIFQLINIQKSNFSNDEYINVAVWPIALGEPSSLLENKYPIRGRIEDIIGEAAATDDALQKLLVALNSPLSSLAGIKKQKKSGLLKNIYFSADARSLVE